MAVVLVGEAPLWDGKEAGVRGREVEEKAVKAEELVGGGCTGNSGFVSRFWFGAGVEGETEKAEKGCEGGGEGEGKEEKTLDLWGWAVDAKAEKGVGRGRRAGAGVNVNLKVQKLTTHCEINFAPAWIKVLKCGLWHCIQRRKVSHEAAEDNF